MPSPLLGSCVEKQSHRCEQRQMRLCHCLKQHAHPMLVHAYNPSAIASATLPHCSPHACNACLPVSGSSNERAEAVAVGTWAMQAHVCELPSLRQLVSEKLPTDVIPRRSASACTACTACTA